MFSGTARHIFEIVRALRMLDPRPLFKPDVRDRLASIADEA